MFRSGALFTKNEASQFVSQLLHFFGIAGIAEPLCEFKESFFLLLAGFKSQFHKLHQNAVAAETAMLGNGFDLPVNLLGKRHAPANLLCYSHSSMVHHFGANR